MLQPLVYSHDSINRTSVRNSGTFPKSFLCRTCFQQVTSSNLYTAVLSRHKTQKNQTKLVSGLTAG